MASHRSWIHEFEFNVEFESGLVFEVEVQVEVRVEVQVEVEVRTVMPTGKMMRHTRPQYSPL